MRNQYPSISQTRQITLLAGLCLSGSVAFAQPIDLKPVNTIDVLTHTPKAIYKDQMVIRVRTNSKAQFNAMLALTESVWSERSGVGLLDIQIKSENLSKITALGIPHDVLIGDLDAHTQDTWKLISDQVQLDRTNAANRGAVVHDESWFSNYKQLNEINTYYNNIAAMRPDIATMADIGDSVQGNDIHALTITAPDAPGNLAEDRPVVLWHGATHAREWVSPMTVAYLASKFVDSYNSDPRVQEILETSRIVIVPVTNPDGYLYTWSNERFWRKNRKDNGNGTFGVDLNRNWEYEWGGEGASSDSFSDTYHGPAPFSEAETQVLRDLSLSYGDKLVSHIDYHCYSQLILWPYGYATGVQTPEPDRTFYDNLSTDLSDVIQAHSGIFYNPIQSVDLYPAAGVSSDWFYGELGAKSLTFELRPSSGGLDGFDPPPSTILPTAQENYEAAKLFVERTTQQLNLQAQELDRVEADTQTQVNFTVLNGIGAQDESSALLFTRTGSSGAFTSSSMTNVSTGMYQADLPGVPCDTEIEYYFQITTDTGLVFQSPSQGESDPYSVTAIETTLVHEDDMESDNGWSVGASGDSATTGIWNRMNPQGTAAQPENDHTPSGTDCWVTDGLAGTSLGANDIDGGATTLTSPMLDAIAAGDEAEIVYHRWYSNDQGGAQNEDSMLVQMSTDNGNSWHTLETVTENANQWVEKRFRIADFEIPTDQMRIRFVASDFFSGSIVEAGVDDLRIESSGCSTNPADLNGDGVLNFFDISLFLTAFNSLDPIADFNQDGAWNFFDVSAFLSAFNEG